MIRYVGTPVRVATTVKDLGGTATDQAPTVAVYDPDGTAVFPAPTVESTGTMGGYRADVTPDAAGIWTYVWSVSGYVCHPTADQFTVRTAPRALVASLDELKDQINRGRSNTADDDELRTYLMAATEVVEYKLDGPIVPTTYTERHRVGGDRIVPRKRPLISVTSLTPYQGTALDPSAYTADTDTDTVILRSLWPGEYVLVYRAGPAELRESYKLAGLIIAQHLWRTQHGGGGRQLPAEEVTMVPGFSFAVPLRAIELLQSGMIPTVG